MKRDNAACSGTSRITGIELLDQRQQRHRVAAAFNRFTFALHRMISEGRIPAGQNQSRNPYRIPRTQSAGFVAVLIGMIDSDATEEEMPLDPKNRTFNGLQHTQCQASP